MSDPVEDLYGNLQEVSRILRESAEISLASSVDDLHRKSLLLSAASYFEVKLSNDVQSYSDQCAGEGAPLSSVIRVKAISRQYHTWFDWDRSNANKFFSMFGEGFKKFMEGKVKTDPAYGETVTAFLSIGVDRNRLVHQNFGSFSLEASPDEIIARYRLAKRFVHSFVGHLHEYTTFYLGELENRKQEAAES